MFPDIAALHSALLEKDPKNFVSHHIIEPVPFAFGGNLSAWIEWKRNLADLLEIDPYDIVMTGSAALGFSLNPSKNFKPFDETSDFDCGIISEYHFNIAWRHLRQTQIKWLTYGKKLKTALNTHRSEYIFDGTIATDRIMGILPFGQDWQNGSKR